MPLFKILPRVIANKDLNKCKDYNASNHHMVRESFFWDSGALQLFIFIGIQCYIVVSQLADGWIIW